MRGRQAKLTHKLGIMTRATLRFGSAFPRRRLRRDLREDSRLERLRPGRRHPELCPRGHNPQAFLSSAAAVPPPLQDHLRDGRGISEEARQYWDRCGDRGKQTVGVPSPGTWYRRLRYSSAESWFPSCTGSRTSEPRVHSRSGQWNLRGQKKNMQARRGRSGRRASHSGFRPCPSPRSLPTCRLTSAGRGAAVPAQR